MFPWLMLASSVMQNQQEQGKEKDAREQAIIDMQSRSAGRFGYPQDRLDAERFNKQFRDADKASKDQWMSSMLGLLGSGAFGGDKAKPQGLGNPYSPESQQLSGMTNAKADELARQQYAQMGRSRGLY
jgi:hypothetical protein